MKRAIFLSSAVATLLAGAAFVAIAQQPEVREGFAVRRIEHRLGITDAQREQAKTVLQSERPVIQQLCRQAQAERSELDASGSFDETKVRSIAAKYAETNTEILVERAKVRSEILAVLTPEQRTKVEALRSDFISVVDARLQTLGDQL